MMICAKSSIGISQSLSNSKAFVMKFCHIAPTQWISLASQYSDCFLSLAHLVESDDDYVLNMHAGCVNAEHAGTEIVKIMDNSGFEYYKEHGAGYVFDPHKLIDLGTKISAQYIVLPDYPAQEGRVTINAARKYAPMFKNRGFGTFFCPQSEIGKRSQYLEAIRWAAESPLIDYIGISILGAPNAFGVEKDNKLQRYTCRAWLMKLLYEDGILDKIRKNNKKIHFLGMVDGPNEIALVEHYHDYIDSWDSSAAVWAGLNGVRFDNSPTGLLNGKFETPVDFKFPISNTDQYSDVIENMLYINRLIDRNI